MEVIFDILKYTIPSVIVLLTSYFIINSYLRSDRDKRKLEITLDNQKIITPIKLQAYERLTLLLERISPESLIMRTNKPGMTAQQLQAELLSSIRAEFEHNLSQQVYISIKAWDVIKGAKANLIRIINSAAENIDPKSEAIILSRAIIEMERDLEKTPTRTAINFLKQELNQFI